VTFRRVASRVESGLAWQAQYSCIGFRRCVAVFVAGAARYTCLAAQFLRIALSGLRPVTMRKFRGRRGILWDVLKIDGTLARNIDFEVAHFGVHKKTRRKG